MTNLIQFNTNNFVCYKFVYTFAPRNPNTIAYVQNFNQEKQRQEGV